VEAQFEDAAAAVWMYPLAADRTLTNDKYSASAGGCWLRSTRKQPERTPEGTLKLSSIAGALSVIHQMVVLIEPNLPWKLHH